MADKPHQTQEQSIKARKNQLFDDDAPALSGPRKPFRDFLRDTPAAPLSGATRAILWAAGVVVVALLIAGVVKALGRHNKAGDHPPAASAAKRS